jgi:hypothetical protein
MGENVSATEFEGNGLRKGKRSLETRRRAAEMYNELRSLPDSLRPGTLSRRSFQHANLMAVASKNQQYENPEAI